LRAGRLLVVSGRDPNEALLGARIDPFRPVSDLSDKRRGPGRLRHTGFPDPGIDRRSRRSGADVDRWRSLYGALIHLLRCPGAVEGALAQLRPGGAVARRRRDRSEIDAVVVGVLAVV